MASLRKRLKKNRDEQRKRWKKFIKASAYRKPRKAAKHRELLISLELQERRIKDSKE